MLRATIKDKDGNKISTLSFDPNEYSDADLTAEQKVQKFIGRACHTLRTDLNNARLDITFDLRTKTEGLEWANERTDELNELRSRQLDVTIPPQDEPTRTLFDVARLRVPTLSSWVGIGCPGSGWLIDGIDSYEPCCCQCEECWNRPAIEGARAHRNPALGAWITTDTHAVPASID